MKRGQTYGEEIEKVLQELQGRQGLQQDLHENDEAFHPLDGIALITAEAGEGFRERLARRGTQVHITTEPDPHTAVALLLDGRLPRKMPTVPERSQYP